MFDLVFLQVLASLLSLAACELGYGYGGHSHVYRTTEGLTEGYYGKRSAEPGYGYSSGVSYYHRSPQGVQGYGYGGYHKRSAEPGYGYHHGHGQSYVHQDRDHYHGSYGYEIEHDYKKRSAEAGYGHGGDSYQYVNRPYSDYKIEVYHPQTYHIWGDFLSGDIFLLKMTKLGFCNRDNFLSCNKNFMKFFVHNIWEL